MMRGGSIAFDERHIAVAEGGGRWAAGVDAVLNDRGTRVPLPHFAADSALCDMIVSCSSVAICVSCRLVSIGPVLECTVRALACAVRTAAGRTGAR